MARRSSHTRRHDDRDWERVDGAPGAMSHAQPSAGVKRDTRGEAPDEHDVAGRMILREAADPAVVTAVLAAMDDATRTRALGELQHAHGNRYVGQILAGLDAGSDGGVGRPAAGDPADRTVHVEQRARGVAAGEAGVQRQDEEPVGDEVVEPTPLDTAASATTGATEQIGPETSSPYDVEAGSLADVVSVIGARPEAGHVGWALSLSYTTSPKGLIDTCTVTADISLEMPSWTPPSTMLPKAKAEWNRWYAALKAHEQGHITRVHENFDGLAGRLIGKAPKTGQALFDAAKAKLAADSAAYDKATDHGRKTGTVMDGGIEEKEREEKAKKEKEGEKPKAPSPGKTSVGAGPAD